MYNWGDYLKVFMDKSPSGKPKSKPIAQRRKPGMSQERATMLADKTKRRK